MRIRRDQDQTDAFQANLAGVGGNIDGGAEGSGLSSGPAVAGGSSAWQRSVQMNLHLNAQDRRN